MGKQKISIVESTEPQESEAPATEPEAQDTKIVESDDKPKEPQLAPSKKGKMITCQLCNKTMLEKTFKYYHHLKCRPNEPTNEAKHVVEFTYGRQVQGKTSRYGNLFSKAV